MRAILIRRIGPSVAVALVLAAVASSAQAAASSDQQPFPVATYTSCNDDVVSFSGTVHSVFEFTQNADGGLSGTAHVNFDDVTGVGSFGDTYRVVSEENAPFSFNTADNATVQIHLGLVSNGSSPNLDVTEIEHVTINANGEPTANVVNVSINCTG